MQKLIQNLWEAVEVTVGRPIGFLFEKQEQIMLRLAINHISSYVMNTLDIIEH